MSIICMAASVLMERPRMLTRDHNLLRDLLLEAKKMYYHASKNMISIYVTDPDP